MMPLFTIDPKICRRDGLCALACPARIIALADQDSLPAPLPGADELCIGCGHCVAVCPQGALTHRTMSPAECPPIEKELALDPARAEQFLRSRRSCRNYRDRPVDRETMTELIRLASYAPSGHNSQPVHWLVIQERGDVRKLAGLVVDFMRGLIQNQVPAAKEFHMDRIVTAWEAGVDRITRGAPHLIVAHAPKSNNFAPVAATIALTYLELAASTLGLGCCWAGYLNTGAHFHPPVTEALALPEGHQHLGIMMVGYPVLKYHRLPRRNRPRITWR